MLDRVQLHAAVVEMVVELVAVLRAQEVGEVRAEVKTGRSISRLARRRRPSSHGRLRLSTGSLQLLLTSGLARQLVLSTATV